MSAETRRNVILQGDAWQLAKTLPDESINCIVTSPPYFGLRDYGDSGQFGLESTPEEYVDKLVALFRELRRALRDDGTVWLNLGDSYGANYRGGGIENASVKQISNRGTPAFMGKSPPRYPGIKPKDLIGIPWRVAFALQADGWWLRQDIIWHKPNPMPESVTDRCTKAHEYIFLLSKSANYHYDAEAIKEPAQDWGTRDRSKMRGGTTDPKLKHHGLTNGNNAATGRNKRSVWTVTTKPYKGAHFAVMPEALVKPCILAGCPHKVCAECGAPWARQVEREAMVIRRTNNHPPELRTRSSGTMVKPPTSTTIGFAPTCDCNGDTQPGVVLDPFMGSGTVAVVARRLGRDWLGFELNGEYTELAWNRIEGAQPPLFEVTA